MKIKTEAAKVLLEAGWSWEEVRGVLEEDKVVPVIPNPTPYVPNYPYGPNYNPYPLWDTSGTNTEGIG